MTQHNLEKLQSILEDLANTSPDVVEVFMLEQWRPFILSLAEEEDRVLAFQMLYEWHIKRSEQLLQHLKTLPERQHKAAASSF